MSARDSFRKSGGSRRTARTEMLRCLPRPRLGPRFCLLPGASLNVFDMAPPSFRLVDCAVYWTKQALQVVNVCSTKQSIWNVNSTTASGIADLAADKPSNVRLERPAYQPCRCQRRTA